MSVATRRALYGKLAGDSTLNALLHAPPPLFAKSIYFEVAASDADYPFVIIQKQAGTPRFAFKSTAPMVDEVWLVKAVDRDDTGKGTADTAEAISDRLKVLLDDASLSISGVTHLYLRYESDVDYSEVTESVRYIHSGSLFRLIYT